MPGACMICMATSTNGAGTGIMPGYPVGLILISMITVPLLLKVSMAISRVPDEVAVGLMMVGPVERLSGCVSSQIGVTTISVFGCCASKFGKRNENRLHHRVVPLTMKVISHEVTVCQPLPVTVAVPFASGPESGSASNVVNAAGVAPISPKSSGTFHKRVSAW